MTLFDPLRFSLVPMPLVEASGPWNVVGPLLAGLVGAGGIMPLVLRWLTRREETAGRRAQEAAHRAAAERDNLARLWDEIGQLKAKVEQNVREISELRGERHELRGRLQWYTLLVRELRHRLGLSAEQITTAEREDAASLTSIMGARPAPPNAEMAVRPVPSPVAS